MRIGELSERTGISTSRIRFYEKHDVLPKPARNGNGYRTYPDTAAKILELIDTAQQLGFSLNEISRRPHRSGAKSSVKGREGRRAAKQARSHRSAHERSPRPAAADREAARGNGRLSAVSRRAGGAERHPRVRCASPILSERTDRSLTHCLPVRLWGCGFTQYRSAAGEAMNANAALQVPLASARCGLMQSETVPNVAVGQN